MRLNFLLSTFSSFQLNTHETKYPWLDTDRGVIFSSFRENNAKIQQQRVQIHSFTYINLILPEILHALNFQNEIVPPYSNKYKQTDLISQLNFITRSRHTFNPPRHLPRDKNRASDHWPDIEESSTSKLQSVSYPTLYCYSKIRILANFVLSTILDK